MRRRSRKNKARIVSMPTRSKVTIRISRQISACWLQKLILIAALTFIGACATESTSGLRMKFNEEVTSEMLGYSAIRHIDVNRYDSATSGAPTMICTPPRRTVYDESDTSYVALRMAPYRACQGVSRGQISKTAYRAFLEDYSALLLLVAGIKSLAQLEMDTSTTTHREALESLATENVALKLMCAHPDLFAIDREPLDLCIVRSFESNVKKGTHFFSEG